MITEVLWDGSQKKIYLLLMNKPTWSTPPGTIIDGYDATPPQANTKCIVFTLICALSYWFLPPKNKWILLSLIYFPYLIMAYYDYFYDCQRNAFGPTFLEHYYSWAKPYYSKQNVSYRNWHPKWKNLVFKVDAFILIIILLLTGPFLNWKP
jgi:hypothetical protein